jgi:hypothetical protein
MTKLEFLIHVSLIGFFCSLALSLYALSRLVWALY